MLYKLKKSCGFISFLFLSFLMSKQAVAFNVGVGVHPNGYTGTEESLIQLMKKYNFNSFRTDYKWDSVEKIKGHYLPPNTKTEKILNIARKNGIDPVIILDYGNGIYGTNRPITDQEITAYTNYVAWTVKHFKGKVSTFEIWNEWSNRVHPGANSNESAKDYVKLVRATSYIIRKENPHAIIIAGSFNPMDYIDLKWGEEIVRLGIMKYVDGLSIHPYTYGSKRATDPELNMHFLDKTQEKLMRLADLKSQIPLYITEIGLPIYGKTPVFDQQEVARYAYDYINLASKKEYIKGVWWYDLIDDGNDKENREDNFGILNRNLTEKKQANSIKEIIDKISK
jgi:polysaccharide biosynthesis protein PslG